MSWERYANIGVEDKCEDIFFSEHHPAHRYGLNIIELPRKKKIDCGKSVLTVGARQTRATSSSMADQLQKTDGIHSRIYNH